MLRTAVTSSVICWLVIMAAAGCTQSDSNPSAEPEGLPSAPTPTASVSTTTTDASESTQGDSTSDTPPPQYEMNELEEQLLSAMSSVGVEGAGVAEHGIRTASISGGWHGRTALVHGYEIPAPWISGDVVDAVDVGGMPAEVVATETFGDVVRFECGAVGYDVASLAGDGEPGSSDVSSAVELTRLLIQELPC